MYVKKKMAALSYFQNHSFATLKNNTIQVYTADIHLIKKRLSFSLSPSQYQNALKTKNYLISLLLITRVFPGKLSRSLC